MARHKASKVYVFHFTVEGSGSFPSDMLRYDSCFPVSETEARSIARDDATGRRTIRLQRVGSNTNGPTERRWESFGWHVTACEPVNPTT